MAGSGCDTRRHDPFNPNADAPAYNLGDAEQYREHKLYFDLMKDHRVLLVSRPASGGTMLVALDARCPNDGKPVEYSDINRLLNCTGCDSRWTTDGLIRTGSIAKDSLDRYRIRLAVADASGQRDLWVETSRRYRKRHQKTIGSKTIEVQEWSVPDSMYMFERDPRYQDLRDKVRTKADTDAKGSPATGLN